jgi:hypothetical protein
MWRRDARMWNRDANLRSRDVDVRYVNLSSTGGAGRRKYQCANYREVGSRIAGHGFTSASARQPVADFQNEKYRTYIDPIGG